MKSLFNFILSLCVLMFALVASLRVMNAMLVHDDARIVLSTQACPIKLDADGVCVVSGSLSHELLTGDAQIGLKDGSVVMVPTESVRSAMWNGDNSHYEPFGKIGAMAIGLAILFAGVVFAIGSQLVDFKRARDKLNLARTKTPD